MDARESRTAQHDEDAAAVIAVLAAIAAQQSAPAERPRSLWGSPAHRLGVIRPGARSWWASGLGG